MNIRLLPILLLLLVPCVLRAQQSAPARVGDTLDLRIAGVPNEESAAFNGSYTIDNDGMVSLPYIEKVKVAGLLPTQIQEALQKSYIQAKIYTHPTITVQQNAVPRYVNVNGEVKAPQRVLFTADLTLLNAITACGGFSDFADKGRVDLKRGDDVKRYNAKDIQKGKTQDPSLMPGDQIVVHQGF